MDGKEIMDEYARYKYVVENIKEVVWEVDLHAVFTFISPTIKEMAGYEVEQMIGRCILEFLTDDSREFILNELKNASNKEVMRDKGRSYLYDVEFICKDGTIIWSEVSVKPVYKGSKLVCYVGTSRDISEKKMYEKKLREMLENQKRINEQLEHMATFDMLTGAYNRRKFEFFVTQEIEKAEKYGSPFSISVFDIDNFKQINDGNGHSKGDLVLRDITALIRHMLRETDKLFRWGGDEFIVLLPDTGLKNALKVANKIRETIQSYKFDIEGGNATVSMGVGVYDMNETPDQLVIRVDKAMLRAKNNGRNIVEQC